MMVNVMRPLDQQQNERNDLKPAQPVTNDEQNKHRTKNDAVEVGELELFLNDFDVF